MSPTLASSSWWERVIEGKPMERVREWYAWYCLGMVLLAGVLDQADKWALASLQAAGLQCSSCGVPSDPFYPSCIEQCLPLDDVAMGFLTGPALSIGALLAGLPLGWAADRYSRVRLLWLGLLLWSGATLASAFVVSFWQLAVARIVLGVGQAAVNPTGFSLLADWFVPRRRGLVLSIFSSMIFVGQICGLMTGAVSQHWSWRVAFAVLGAPGLVLAVPFILTVWEPKRGLHDVLGHATPQPEAATLHLGAGDGAIGIGTLITSPPVDAVAAAGPLDHDLKPRRRTSYSSGHYQHDDTTAPIEYYTEHDLDVASSTTATTTTTADAQGSSGIPGPVPLLVRTRYIVTHLPFVMYVGVHSLADSMRRGGDCLIAIARCRLAVSAAARFMGGYAIGATIQVFFRRVYGVQPATISYAMSFIVTVGGLPACYIGGWLADTWNLRDPAGKVWVCAMSSLLAAPTMAACLLAPYSEMSFAFLLVSYLIAEQWYGPAMAVVQDLTHPCTRSLATAIYLIAGGVGALSPLIVGFMNTLFHPDADAPDPTYSLLLMVSASYILSALLFFVTGMLVRRFHANTPADNPFGVPDYMRQYVDARS